MSKWVYYREGRSKRGNQRMIHTICLPRGYRSEWTRLRSGDEGGGGRPCLTFSSTVFHKVADKQGCSPSSLKNEGPRRAGN